MFSELETDRFLDKVLVTEGTSCWLWGGAVSKNGYGQFFTKTGTAAHRQSYQHFVGEIQADKTIDHLCRNKRCVNPGHLEAVSSRENTMRCEDAPATVNARKTACVHGHSFTEVNTYVTPDGRRQCRICLRDRQAKHRERGWVAAR